MSADINVGAITEALNNKVDLVIGVPQDAVDYVVAMQRPTADNNYTWYRKYKSGWVEQGGYVASNGNSDQHITLPVQMAYCTYNVDTKAKSSATSRQNDTNDANRNTVFYYSKIIYNQTETGFNIGSSTEMSIVGVYWQVSGIAA